MVSDEADNRRNRVCRWVLILVLMEYGLWPQNFQFQGLTQMVLILVLMEYGLWRCRTSTLFHWLWVLILVLMEYGLWPVPILIVGEPQYGLNPCSNGIWSLTTILELHKGDRIMCLNPCSNGIWSLTLGLRRIDSISDSLNPCSNGIWSLTTLMLYFSVGKNRCLNPCSNGIWSLTVYDYDLSDEEKTVLILVLMEYGLWRSFSTGSWRRS